MSWPHLVVDRWDIHRSVLEWMVQLGHGASVHGFDLGSGDALVESSRQIVAGDEMRPPASLRLSNEKEK